MSAADDLGLTEHARQDYKRRLSLMFKEGCIIFGAAAAARMFREESRLRPKLSKSAQRSLPPQKRKGPHDPEGDRLLLQLWKTASNGVSKREFARMALRNHAVKIGGKIRRQDKPAQIDIAVNSLVRRLNRIIRRSAKVRQLGR